MGIDAVKRAAVFLDRDGVINRSVVRGGVPYPPATLEELEILPGVAEALARLRAAGFPLIVVSNQPDVARGTQSRAFVEAVNAALLARGLPIDSFRMCYHDDRDECACRKPKPGLLIAAAEEGDIQLANSYMVGDRWRDMEAGRAAGCAVLLVDYHYAETKDVVCDARVHSLAEAAEWILSYNSQRSLS